MKTFFVEIITPQRQAFAQEAEAVAVPTLNGTIGVLAHHVPLFSALNAGEVKITSGGKNYFLAIGGGFIQVSGNRVSILVSRAYHADELNEAEIKKARQEAQDAIGRRVKGQELLAAQALLRRSSMELRVMKRRRPQATV
jgi:F-type H+-transporting ATPase subunit epsilon